jgi:hypothetical protein
MLVSNIFVILCRIVSIVIILLMAFTLNVESFSYKSIFVGLLFSHFFYGLYYSKKNITHMKEKKYALIIAISILLIGLYFSIYVVYLAPYFLVVHVALSDAYLLTLKTKMKSIEHMKFLKTFFYIVCFGLLFIKMNITFTIAFLILALISLAIISYYSESKKNLIMFELPIIAIVIYAMINQTIFNIQYLGFYHILTWYVFSFWMLFVKENNTRKTITFFSKVFVLSAIFVLLFTFVMKVSITQASFAQIIGFWSILHITSSISLSKFNPQIIKNIFYTTIK